MSTALAQWSRCCRKLLIGRHGDEADAAPDAVAVPPALGPVPPLLVRTRLASDREH